MITILDGQSLFDLSLQECGGVEAVVAFAIVNGLSVTDVLTAGEEVVATDVVNPAITNYYKLHQLRPATDVTVDSMDELRDEGIDFWAVDVDFIVQ